MDTIKQPLGDAFVAEKSVGHRFGAVGGFDPRLAGAKGAATKRRRKEVRKQFQDIMDDGLPLVDIKDLESKIQLAMFKGDIAKAMALRLIGFGLAGNMEDLDKVIANNEGRLANKSVVAGDPDNPLTMVHIPVTAEERAREVMKILDAAQARINAKHSDNENGSTEAETDNT